MCSSESPLWKSGGQVNRRLLCETGAPRRSSPPLLQGVSPAPRHHGGLSCLVTRQAARGRSSPENWEKWGGKLPGARNVNVLDRRRATNKPLEARKSNAGSGWPWLEGPELGGEAGAVDRPHLLHCTEMASARTQSCSEQAPGQEGHLG